MSLVGNILADGSASFFDTVGRLADRTGARHYPMPLPFLMESQDERDRMVRIDAIAKVKAVADKADLKLIGIGQMDQKAQMHVDGFVTREELTEMMRLGAVGEITGWAYDAKGKLIKGGTNRRLTSIPPRCAGEGADDRRRARAGEDPRDRRRACRPPDQRADHRRSDRARDPGLSAMTMLCISRCAIATYAVPRRTTTGRGSMLDKVASL